MPLTGRFSKSFFASDFVSCCMSRNVLTKKIILGESIEILLICVKKLKFRKAAVRSRSFFSCRHISCGEFHKRRTSADALQAARRTQKPAKTGHGRSQRASKRVLAMPETHACFEIYMIIFVSGKTLFRSVWLTYTNRWLAFGLACREKKKRLLSECFVQVWFCASIHTWLRTCAHRAQSVVACPLRTVLVMHCMTA